MLTWVGKQPLRHVTAFPAQLVEVFDPAGDADQRRGEVWKDWPERYPRGGLLFHGDNKEVLAHLLANGFRGKVNLVYIDPPFDSGADYVRKVTLRGPKGTAKLDGEAYTLGEQLQYTDIWANDNYLQFMYERLLLLRELLANDGSLYLHCDANKSHLLRCLLDEVFGSENFKNEIALKSSKPLSNVSGKFGEQHQTLFFYVKDGNSHIWNPPRLATDRKYLRQFSRVDRVAGKVRRYQLVSLLNRRGVHRSNLTYEFHGHVRTWKYKKERMYQLEREGKIELTKRGMPRLKLYVDDLGGRLLQDFWSDTSGVQGGASEEHDYPTQKPEVVLERIIKASTKAGGLVLDCFVGSGTTAAVAQRLGRRWIACDINKGAIQTTSKRLQTIIEAWRATMPPPRQPTLAGVEKGGRDAPLPMQLSFAVHRVNDYDLAIQHLEAVELACEHIGVTRTRTDRFFEGTLGKKLVKIVPFNHPLTLLDLEDVKRELDARPGEDRDVVMVCLGKEPAADGWIADWNRLRRGQERVNRIEVIELRTDPKYGKVFQHQPARARVKVARRDEVAVVEVQDFISPSVVERLQAQGSVLQPKIDDWRAMVDCILIDADYDGRVFRVVLSDIPEKKADMVTGRYEVAVGRDKPMVAVKVIDMLGEEVLTTHALPAAGA